MFFQKLNLGLSVIYRIFSTLPSRLIFGNCSKLSNNLLPYLNLFYWKLKFDNNPIEKKGYLKLSYNLDQELILNVKNQFNKLMDDPDKIYTQKSASKKLLLKNPMEIGGIKKLTAIFNDELRNYYQGNYVIDRISCWRTLHDNSRLSNKENYVYSNYWHFDDFRLDKLTVFILLNDYTDENSGSTKLLNVKNTKYLTRVLKYLDTSVSNFRLDNFVKKNNMIVYCNGYLGEAYIVNTSKCLHSASIPGKNKHRDLIQFEIYYSKNCTDPFEKFN